MNIEIPVCEPVRKSYKLDEEMKVTMKRFDINNFNQQLIITGMMGLIDDGLSFHEMMRVVEEIKSQTFPAMMELSRKDKRS